MLKVQDDLYGKPTPRFARVRGSGEFGFARRSPWQEKATLMCGNHVVEWQDLVDAFQEVTALGLDRYAADLTACEEGYGIMSLRRRFQSDRRIELEDLFGGQKAACSDPRDKSLGAR
jgi:hypothetical protein